MRTRFAPSPTGFLHIGSLRTVLFDYLTAKSLQGTFILRIEDTDQKREVAGAVEGLIDILDWLGIRPDEGPNVGGQYGPYIQSQRLDIYNKHKEEILARGGAYHCFCAPERLDKMRADQQANKLPPRYDRACRNLTEEETTAKINNGEKYVIRQAMPLDGELVVHDELRGDIKFKYSDLDDHVLIKSDGMPTYQFASVVDDHTMAITHVMRGDEWLSSFPKNILLYQAFGWEAPKFMHISLIMNKEGGKLSKRQGDVAVEDFRAKGYLPEALLNFCVLMGWHPKGDNEILSLQDMQDKFKIEDIGISPSIFDIEKLDYFNGYHIRQKPLDELVELCLPYLEENLKLANEEKKKKSYIKKVIALEQERLKKLSDIASVTKLFFTDNLDYDADLLIWKKLTAAEVKSNLQIARELLERIPSDVWTHHSVGDALKTHIEAKQLKTGDYLWPMRVALTGEKASPGPFEVAEVLGKEESLKRISEALKKL